MAIIQGLTSSEQIEAFMSLNSRRRVFYEFPNGAAPLIGLLSMIDTEATSFSEFGWWEDRFQALTATTQSISSGNGTFSASGSDTPKTAAGFNIAENDVLRILVDSTLPFQVSSVIEVGAVPVGSSNTPTDLTAVVTAIISSTKLEARFQQAETGVKNGDGTGGTQASSGLTVTAIGTANEEGASSIGNGLTINPVNVTNYTQIFRKAFGFTRTAMKLPLQFDMTGEYKTKAKKNSMYHMIDLEWGFIRGNKQQTTVTTSDGDVVPMKTTGGILNFLKNWESGTVYGNTAADPTDDEDPNKRIINNADGVMTITRFNSIMKRLFRVTSNASFEKICLCGDQHLSVLNEMFKGLSVLQTTTYTTDAMWGPTWVSVQTIYGKVHFKTHPLFQRYGWEANGLYLDLGTLKYRNLLDSDTTLLKMRQAPDADRRKDEWLTEAGLECNLPEGNMFVKNLQTFRL